MRQTVSVDGSTIDNGGIYVAGLGANTISVTNSTVDATNSQVAASLAELAQRIADSGIPVDVSNVDNLAIGLFGGAEQHADFSREHRYRRRGLTRSRSNGTNKISVTGGSRIEGNLVHRGPSLANVNFDASAIVGNIRASNTDVVMQNGSTFEGSF